MSRNAPRIGLALGGGGIAGYSFHAGALGAIEEATGWDPRTAEVIIGTSAGSSIASVLRGNVAVPELVERVLSVPTDPAGMSRLRDVAGRGQSLLGGWISPASPALVAREVLRFHRIRPLNVLAGSLPVGKVDNEVLGEQAAVLHGLDWPSRETWIPAVALDTGDVTVFGRDSVQTDLATAVAASCAIPAFFQPVTINGRRYIDGGVRSMMNVDLLAELDLDLVVALSPMSIDGLHLRSPFASLARGLPKLQLRRELGVLHDVGIPTVCLEPDLSVSKAVGANPMDPTRVVTILAASAVAVAAELTKTSHKPYLDLLREAGMLLESPENVPYPD